MIENLFCFWCKKRAPSNSKQCYECGRIFCKRCYSKHIIPAGSFVGESVNLPMFFGDM